MPTPIPENDIGRGLDQFHPESRIPEGYALDLLNVEPTNAGTLKKRAGWERFAGGLPLRVRSFERTGATIRLTFDDWVDCSLLRPTPIVVYGKRGSGSAGDYYPSNVAKYFATFTVPGSTASWIEITDSSGSGAIAATTDVQMSVWGIPVSSVIASTASERAGWITGLASYKSSTAEHLVSIMGGVLHAGLARAEISATYLVPSLYPRLFTYLPASTQVTGRAFYDVAPSLSPTRGYIVVNSAPGGLLRVISAAYDTGTGYTTFVLAAPGYSVSTTLAGVLRSGIDWLTTAGMGDALDGEHLIVGVPTVASNQITIVCDVVANRAADAQRSEAEAYGRAGVFSDQITVSGDALIIGDQLDGGYITYDDYGLSVIGQPTPSTLVLSPCEDPITFFAAAPNTVYLAGRRTTQAIPLGGLLAFPSSANFLRGDVVTIAGYDRRFVVRNVWTEGDDNISIAGDGAEATVTLVNSTARLSVGDYLQIYNSASYTGTVQVTEIVSSTSFRFASTLTVVDTGAKLRGNVIGIDEAVEVVQNGAVTVSHRWIPREAPETLAVGVPATYPRYFDVAEEDDCDYVSTAMIAENLYLANGRDEVLKYDGTSVYRAGLPSWPFAISGLIRTSSTPITNPTASVATSAHTAGTRAFTVAAGDEDFFDVGDYVEIVDDAGYTSGSVLRTAVAKTASTDVRTVDASVSGGGLAGITSIYKQMSFRYYFRAVYTDSNGNRINGPGIRSRDLVFRVGAPSEVQFLISCFPPVDNYPWDRLELEIYRTSGTEGTPPFVRIGTLAFPFQTTRAYMYFRDVVQPDGSSDGDPTAVLSAGATVGSGWREPPISKYATSAANRLILANIRSNQQMAVTIRRKAGVSSLTSAACPSFAVRRDTSTALFAATDDMNAAVYLDPVYYTSLGTHIIVDPVLYQFSGTALALRLPAPVAGVGIGSWVQLTHINELGINEKRGATYCGWHQIRTDEGGGLYTIATAQPLPAAQSVVGWDEPNDEFELSATTSLTTGDPVFFRRTGGPALPAGFAEFATYFARLVSGTVISLHLTQADALANTNKITSATGSLVWAASQLDLHYGDVDAYPTHAVFAPNRALGDAYVPVYLTGEAGTTPVLNRKDFLYADVPRGDVTQAATETYEAYLCRRYADAINGAMRAVDVSLNPTFQPWILADAGSDVGYGILRLETPKATVAFRAGTNTTAGGWEVLVDGVRVDHTTTPGTSSQAVYPSRIVRSYPNYPELFDRPFGVNALEDSDSAIDVNPNDGDEIVGIRPFFADSFSAGSAGSAKEQMILVEKRRAKYAVNVETREVQLIETNETGTDFVRSTAPTKNGIASATSEGVFAVDRQLSLRYIGELISRLWKKRVNRNAIEDVPVGHHDAADRKYLLAVPVLDASDAEINTEVLVYDYVRDSGSGDPTGGGAYGAWSRWTGFGPSTFARHAARTYYGGYDGLVYRRRAEGDATDYRDDSAPISSAIELRPTAFGAPGLRKKISAVQLEFRIQSNVEGIRVSVATDLGREYLTADSLSLQYAEASSGVGDVQPQSTWSIQYSLPVPKAEFISIRIENDAADEGFELSGVTWLVDAGGPEGLLQAAQTTK